MKDKFIPTRASKLSKSKEILVQKIIQNWNADQVEKFWINFEQDSSILKTFHVSSSAGNSGCLWMIGLKIKSYYEILHF